MWCIEDLEELNSTVRDERSASFLLHVLKIGAASETLLCQVADKLEQLEQPSIALFAQLPFAIDSEIEIETPGTRKSLVLSLSLQRKELDIDLYGNVKVREEEHSNETETFSITQVVGILPLWGSRLRIHEKYQDQIYRRDSASQVIGSVENWMSLPEAGFQLPKRRHAPLTTYAFETEITRRCREELLAATNNVLNACSLANLVEIEKIDKLYGYFAMACPGRLSSASSPIPIVSGICSRNSNTIFKNEKTRDIATFLNKSNYRDNRFVSQIMAMHRLLEQGEPELALVGALSAIEWHLNEVFPEMIERFKSGRMSRASIVKFLKSKKLDMLSDSEKGMLFKYVDTRNELVHGAPPTRYPAEYNSTDRNISIDSKQVRDCIFLIMDIYRRINIQPKSKTEHCH